MRPAAALALVALLGGGPAYGVRPTEPDSPYAYAADDELAFHDSEDGSVRVHYSMAGPTATLMADADEDGIPDFVAQVASSAVTVLTLYRDDLGLRAPVSEAELGLGELGGSAAFDIYLVDFAGIGDGHFEADVCTIEPPLRCGGALLVENDFQGYGYPSPSYGAELLIAHELFHAVQSAYRDLFPTWMSEGSAVWGAAQVGQPGMDDLVGFGAAYLADTGRSIFKPPSGPVPSFAYGTGLFFDFLAHRHGGEVIAALLETADAEPDVLVGLASVLATRDDELASAWRDFALWNLATGEGAGSIESYPYAHALSGITPESSGPTVDDDGRYYPLSATYYQLSFAGGPLWFGASDPMPGVWFSLHRMKPGGLSAMPATAQWEASEAGAWALLDGASQPAAWYWLVVANTAASGESQKARVCLGQSHLVEPCAPAADPDPGPEPEPDTPPEPAPADAGAAPVDLGGAADVAPDAPVAAEPTLPKGTDTGGCRSGGGFQAGDSALALAALLLIVGWLRRRHRIGTPTSTPL